MALMRRRSLHVDEGGWQTVPPAGGYPAEFEGSGLGLPAEANTSPFSPAEEHWLGPRLHPPCVSDLGPHVTLVAAYAVAGLQADLGIENAA